MANKGGAGQPVAPRGDYAPLNLTAGTNVNTTSGASTVGAAGAATITPGDMTNIKVGTLLTCDVSTSQEVVQVTAIVPGVSFTATFTKTHGAGFAIVATIVHPVGACVACTAVGTGAITAGTGVVITPDDPTVMPNITRLCTEGKQLGIAGGTGTAEFIKPYNPTATTFTADFINNHSGPYYFYSLRGTWIGPLIIGNHGTSDVLTLWNGYPGGNPVASKISTITFAANMPDKLFACEADQGLFYSLAGTAGDYTLHYIDMTS